MTRLSILPVLLLLGADSLGPHEVGGPVPTTLQKNDSGEYFEDIRLGGQHGRLIVTPEGSKVSSIRFVLGASFYTNNIESNPWLEYANDPTKRSKQQYSSLLDSLEAADWEVVKTYTKKELRNGLVKAGWKPISGALLERAGERRRLKLSCISELPEGAETVGDVVAFSIVNSTCVVVLTTLREEPVTYGL